MRTAIGLSVIPGLLAAGAIIHAVRAAAVPHCSERRALRFHICPVLRGDLGRLMGAVAAFETGNIAATLMILRASTLLAPGHGAKGATTLSSRR